MSAALLTEAQWAAKNRDERLVSPEIRDDCDEGHVQRYALGQGEEGDVRTDSRAQAASPYPSAWRSDG